MHEAWLPPPLRLAAAGGAPVPRQRWGLLRAPVGTAWLSMGDACT